MLRFTGFAQPWKSMKLPVHRFCAEEYLREKTFLAYVYFLSLFNITVEKMEQSWEKDTVKGLRADLNICSSLKAWGSPIQPNPNGHPREKKFHKQTWCKGNILSHSNSRSSFNQPILHKRLLKQTAWVLYTCGDGTENIWMQRLRGVWTKVGK